MLFRSNSPGIPSGPTPDPDLDDVELVPVVTGDGMGAITSVCTFYSLLLEVID